MARNDVYLYTNATSPADAVVTAQQDTTAATAPDLVLGDAPLFNFRFTDGTGSWPSWAGDSSYTVTWALSQSVAGDEPPLALQTQATAITGGWSIRLPVNTGALANALGAKYVPQDFPVVRLWQHIRVTDSDGYPVTYALIRTNVRLRAISDTQQTPNSPLPSGTSAVLVDSSGVLVSPTNFFEANLRSSLTVPVAYIAGSATDEQGYGGFTAPVAMTVLGVQLTAQTAPVGSALTVDLTDGNGSELSLVSTLAAGSQHQQTTFGTAYSLAAGGVLKVRVKSVGSTTPGGYVAVNLVCRFANSADAGKAYPLAGVFFGTATDEQTFGGFTAIVPTDILGIQLSAQVAPVGSDITVDLVDSNGTELGTLGTLAAGSKYQATDFATVTALAASDYVRLKIKSVGSSTAGAYLTATLVTRPTA
jgi:hypothetical protein